MTPRGKRNTLEEEEEKKKKKKKKKKKSDGSGSLLHLSSGKTTTTFNSPDRQVSSMSHMWHALYSLLMFLNKYSLFTASAM